MKKGKDPSPLSTSVSELPEISKNEKKISKNKEESQSSTVITNEKVESNPIDKDKLKIDLENEFKKNDALLNQIENLKKNLNFEKEKIVRLQQEINNHMEHHKNNFEKFKEEEKMRKQFYEKKIEFAENHFKKTLESVEMENKRKLEELEHELDTIVDKKIKTTEKKELTLCKKKIFSIN